MEKRNNFIALQILNTISFLAMVLINALANALPLNGVNTGVISDSYPNLFAPAGLTFSIWGVIYLMLGAFTLYQFGVFRGKRAYDVSIIKDISVYFIVSSWANIAWIFSWHYNLIPLSMVLMVVILISLIVINLKLSKSELTKKDKVFVRLPFSIYFGWITVATIANVTVLLVSLGWKGGSFSQAVWTIIVIAVGLLIGVATTLKNRDIAYGFVLLWAYSGILLKHLSPNGFEGEYLEVIVTVMISLAVLVASIVAVQLKKKRVSKV